MDVSGVSSNVSIQQNTTAQAVRTDAPQVRSSLIDKQPVQIPAVESEEPIRADTEDRRFSRVEQAARQVITDFYPIGDTRFTIFKDGSGRYITRFTNLADGSVTFYPEPSLLAMSGAIPDSLYRTKA